MLSLSAALNKRMNPMNTAEIKKCTHLRVFSASFSSVRSTPKISMQKLVVRAVSAESALEKAAATIPMVKNTIVASPNRPSAAKKGRMSSLFSGKAKPDCEARSRSNAPNERKSRLTGTNEIPYAYMFFCASRRLRHERFFCIIS